MHRIARPLHRVSRPERDRSDASRSPAPRASGELSSRRGGAVELLIPDHVREAYLEVRQVGSDEVITVLEILSPTNKHPGEGRRQ